MIRDAILPEGWTVRRLKHLASVSFSSVDKKQVEGERVVQLCNYVDVYYKDVINSTEELMLASATEEEIRRFELKGGDVLVTKDSESWDDIAVPAYVPKTLPGVVCGYHLAQVRPNQSLAQGSYLFRCFQSPIINDQLASTANGVTRFGIGKQALGTCLFPVPPIRKQRAIADFLAWIIHEGV
jgi:type I restriction enzyme S subunit